MSNINRANKLRKHLKRVLFEGSEIKDSGSDFPSYRSSASCKNHIGLFMTTYIPIKQPGETGPKPIMAKMAKIAMHFN